MVSILIVKDEIMSGGIEMNRLKGGTQMTFNSVYGKICSR